MEDFWNSRDYADGGVIRYTTRAFSQNELTVGADFRQLGGEILLSHGELEEDKD